MDAPTFPRTEINGHPARAEELRFPAVVNYGHFTTMQVRDRAVRGLDLHLTRLDAAGRELFGIGLEGDRVRDHVRHALGEEIADATVRVTVFRPAADVSVMVSVNPPGEPPGAPQALQSVVYQRPLPHIKHTGTFGQIHYGTEAERAGFDDALLIDHEGLVSETTIANIGLYDGDAIVWPDAPALPGTTMRLLDRALTEAGRSSRRAPVRLADLASVKTAFTTNSSGISPVARVDDLNLPVDAEIMKMVIELYRAIPMDPI